MEDTEMKYFDFLKIELFSAFELFALCFPTVENISHSGNIL